MKKKVVLNLTEEQIEALQPLLKLCERYPKRYSIMSQAWPEAGKVVFVAATLNDLHVSVAKMVMERENEKAAG